MPPSITATKTNAVNALVFKVAKLSAMIKMNMGF
jgi:hypothetical protein